MTDTKLDLDNLPIHCTPQPHLGHDLHGPAINACVVDIETRDLWVHNGEVASKVRIALTAESRPAQSPSHTTFMSPPAAGSAPWRSLPRMLSSSTEHPRTPAYDSDTLTEGLEGLVTERTRCP